MRRAGPRPAALLLLAVAVAAAAAVGGGAWAEAAADAAPAGDAPVAGMMQARWVEEGCCCRMQAFHAAACSCSRLKLRRRLCRRCRQPALSSSCSPLPPSMDQTEQVVRLDDGTVIQVEEFRGPSRAAALLPYLFTNTAVDVACEGRKARSPAVAGCSRLHPSAACTAVAHCSSVPHSLVHTPWSRTFPSSLAPAWPRCGPPTGAASARSAACPTCSTMRPSAAWACARTGPRLWRWPSPRPGWVRWCTAAAAAAGDALGGGWRGRPCSLLRCPCRQRGYPLVQPGPSGGAVHAARAGRCAGRLPLLVSTLRLAAAPAAPASRCWHCPSPSPRRPPASCPLPAGMPPC